MYIMCVIHVLCLFVALSGGVGALHVSALYFYTALNEDLNKFCIHSDIQIDMRLLTVVIKKTLIQFYCTFKFGGCTSGGVYVPCIYRHAR